MTKVIMYGSNGKMGQVISDLISRDDTIEVVAGIDAFMTGDERLKTFASISQCDTKGDVIIDFSNPLITNELLDYVEKTKTPLVLCTTGLSQEQLDRVESLSESVAILKSANMSLGINMLMKLLQEATKILNPAGFDIEMVEKHHKLKVDAPSGTALALADAMKEVLGEEYSYNYDRSRVREKRNEKEIGISAIRGGTIVGEHEVIFAGEDEVIEFKHTAYSKAVFAKGSIQAAKFLKGKAPGMYDMQDVIN